MANYQQVLRTVTYDNNSQNPNTTSRVISFVANDGTSNSNTGITTVTINAVDDTPTATNLNAAEAYTEDTPLNLIDIVIGDVDSANVTATLTLSDVAAGALSTATSGAVTSTYNTVSGVWSASGALADVNILLAGVTFNPTLNYNANFSIATSVDDGTTTISGDKTMTGTAVDDAPTATNLNAAETYTEDTPLNLIDIVITEVDGDAVTATLTLSDMAAGALSTATSGAVTSTYNAVSGLWSASGALADVNILLAGVTFNPTLDYNANFSIATNVDDGTTTLSGNKAMTGTAVNDNPTITSGNTPSVAENQTAVITVTATDEDLPAQTLGFNITGGADQLLFSINNLSGALTFDTPPDFEAPTDVGANNVYEVQVTVDDGAGGSDVQLIIVTVTDVNDNPTITSGNAPSVAENQTAVITVTATDEDLPAQTLGFNITGGADQLLFSINNLSGALTFDTPPDFEAPTDVGANNVYEVQVTVDDGAGGSDVQLIIVTVTDVNDNPTITSGNAPSVAENQTAVITVTATDEDLSAQTLGFNITGGADQLLFSIDNLSGVLTFDTPPDYEAPTDVGANNTYEVQVTVDGRCQRQRRATDHRDGYRC